MKHYIKLALIVTLFVIGSAVESHADEVSVIYHDDGSQSVIITELYFDYPEPKVHWGATTGNIVRILLNNRSSARQNTTDFFNSQGQRQVMQHGYGGCTPNHSTGGCL